MKRGKFIIIDGNSLANRAYYALPGLSTSSGQPTGAVFGFANMLLRLLEEEKPDFMAVAFDKRAPTFRHAEFDGYKANRKKMPDELASQLPLIKELVRVAGIPIFEIEGFEADDVIGTITRLAEEEGLENLIVTGDRDALQLISDHTRAMITKKGISELETYTPETVRERLGIEPSQVIDMKSLMGDSSDNIPGIPGIGEKTALKLIREFQSLEGVLNNLDHVKPPRYAELIRANEELAHLSRKLATIDRDVPIEVNLEDCRFKGADYRALRGFFKSLEFRSLLKRLGALEPSVDEVAQGISPEVGPEVRYDLILTPEMLARVRSKLVKAGSFALELVWEPGSPMRALPVGIAMALPGGHAYYAPVGHSYEGAPGMDLDGALAVLKPALEDAGIRKLLHDAKPQIIMLSRRGVELRGLAFDTMVASYLMDPGQENHNIARAARFHLYEDIDPVMGLFSPSGRGGLPRSLAHVSADLVANCASRELACVLRLADVLEERLRRDGMDRLFYDVEMPLVETLARMEMAGVAIDVGRLRLLSVEFASRIDALAQEIYALAGEEFNINSPRQLGAILFEKLALPVIKKTKTGYSTDADVLEQLAFLHPIAGKVLEYRELIKLKGTYVDALPALINPDTGRVHTTFNQTVTATGRLSSSDPNLQNIPIRKDEGKKIRQMFIPGREGWLLLSADYSQIELRVLAHFAGDEALIQAFRNDEDIHARTAAEVYGVPLEQVTPEMRARAKAVNFGIIYGISDWGLAKGISVSREEARGFIESYFDHYRGVKAYLDESVRQARETGYVTSLLGRRRYLPDIESPRVPARKFAERTAMNTPIQGSAADIIKLAMVDVEREMRRLGFKARMILQVHDELVFEVPLEELIELAPVVKRIMEGVITLKVPLKAEVVAGPNWLDMEPVQKNFPG